MSWDFAASEVLTALHARHLAIVLGLVDKPLRTLDALRDWRDEVATLQMKLEGSETVTVATPSVIQTTISPARQANLSACSRNVHAWGPIDSRGWATCLACGTVSITGGSIANGAPGGGVEVARATVVELP